MVEVKCLLNRHCDRTLINTAFVVKIMSLSMMKILIAICYFISIASSFTSPHLRHFNVPTPNNVIPSILASHNQQLFSAKSDESNLVTLPQPSLNLLTKGPSQKLFVPIVKFVWNFIWKLMVSELAPHDKDGRFIRDYSKESYVAPSVNILSSNSKYHLYLGNPCPWCHRIYIALALFDSPISVTNLVDNAEKASKGGWIIDEQLSPDPLCNGIDLAAVYNYCSKGSYKGRCTAPLLIDLTTGAIVSNESNDILKLLNKYEKNKNKINLLPTELYDQINELNKYFYNTLQNGVYRCGFATSQLAYDEAANDVITGLKKLEDMLFNKTYILGDKVTEVDIKMWPFVCRYDGAYSILYRAPGGKLKLYPAIYKWAQRMARIPGMAGTINVPNAVGSYYKQLFMLNPSGIVPHIPTNVNELFELDVSELGVNRQYQGNNSGVTSNYNDICRF